MSLKEININREIIDDVIISFCEGVSIEKKEKYDNELEKFHIQVPNQKITVLNVYYKKDGKTTLSFHEGGNKELGEKIAIHIAEKAKFNDKNNAPIYIKSVSYDEFNQLEDFLINYCGAEKIGKTNIPYGTKHVYKSVYGDKINLNHYSTGSFNVQGKSGLLKSQVIEGLSSFLSYGEIVEATLESFDVKDINKSKAEKLLDARLPIATSMLDDMVKVFIIPSFITERIDCETTDYSFMLFPILRGIEGFMKQLLLKDSIIVDRTFGNVFEDSGKTGFFTLNSNTEVKINCDFTKRSLEKMYNYHKSNRHALFHVDGVLHTTRVINDIKDARSLINESAELIEKCAAAIHYKDLNYLK